MCVAPVLTYGPPTWTHTSKLTKKIESMPNSMMRSILGIKLKNEISLKMIKEKLPKIKDCNETI